MTTKLFSELGLSPELLKAMLPWNGWDTSLPTIGSAKSTMNVHLPATGCSVYAVSDNSGAPNAVLFCA